MANPRPISVDLPINGVNRGVAHALRQEATTETALNVRAQAALTARYGLGKRPGTEKAIASQCGENGARRINHIATMPKATDAPSSATGTYVFVPKSFADDLVANPADIGEDLVVFAKQYQTAGHYVTVNYDYQVNSIDLNASAGAKLGTAKGGLVLDWNDALGYPGVAATYGTTNDVTICLYAAFQATADVDNVGKIGEPTNFGPFVRGSGDLKDFIGACLLRDGADDKIKLAIVRVQGATRTTLVQESIPITLASQDWATSKGVGITGNLCIRCVATGTTVTAEVNWPTAGINPPLNPENGLEQIGPNPFRVTINNTDFTGNVRAGAAALFTVGAVPTSGAVANRWHMVGISFMKFVPRDPDVAYQLTRAAGSITPPPQRYYLPGTATGVKVTTGGSVSTFTGTSATTDPGEPSLDTSNIPATGETGSGFVTGGGTASASAFLVPSPVWPEQYAVECRGKAEPGNANTEDIMGAAFRVQAGFGSAVLIEVKHDSDANYKATKQDSFETLRIVQVLAGVRTVLQTLDATNADLPPFKSVHWHRFTDNGANGAVNPIDLGWGQNGYAIKAFAGVQASLAAVFDTPEFRVGSSFFGNNGSSEFTYAFGMRLIDLTNSTAASVAETECRYAAFTAGYVDAGILQSGTRERCNGQGLLNPLVSTAILAGKIFAVDGAAMKVIDPAELTVSDWVAQYGFLPEQCRLAATYRRSIVLARPREDPTLFYIGRTDDPYDWELGADPEATAPIAGNNGNIGQPADPINAIVAFNNDTCWFGCPSSIFSLEGDPRAGGQLQVLSRSTGIVGSRAWCFDGRGALYFIAIDGLYRRAGGRIENISGFRLMDLIDRMDTELLFVQLSYDPFSQHLYITRTPVDGITVGTAIVYDIASNAFWLDQYPLEHGPWAVAQPFGSTAIDRRPLWGGNDGYIRRHNDAVLSDDGAAISTLVDLPIPDAAGGAGGMLEQMVREMQATTAIASGALAWSWFTSSSPEAVSALSVGAVATGTFGGGQQTPQSIRQRGGSHKLRLSQSSATLSWAVERLSIVVEAMGRRR